MFGRPNGFLLYGKLGIDFFSASELLYPKMKVGLQLIKTRPNFYMISDNPNVCLENVDCSLYTRRFALEDKYHKKRIDVLAYTPAEFNYLETLAKAFIIPALKNQFNHENIFNNAVVRRIAFAVNRNFAFTGSYTESPFRYQQFDLSQLRILKGGPPIVHFDATDNYLLYVTTIKAMNIQDDNPSIPVDKFEDHNVLAFDLTLMQDATKIFHCSEIFGQQLRRKPNFTFHLEYVTVLIVLEERMSSVAVGKFGVVGKKSKIDNVCLQQIFRRIPLLKYRYLGSFPSDSVPTLNNDTFAIINTQPSKMQVEHWITFANSRQRLYFSVSLVRKMYSFLKQQFEQMMPEPLQSHPSLCGLYTVYAAFHLLDFRKGETTGVNVVIVLSCIRNYM